jgi:hypothetical protein
VRVGAAACSNTSGAAEAACAAAWATLEPASLPSPAAPDGFRRRRRRRRRAADVVWPSGLPSGSSVVFAPPELASPPSSACSDCFRAPGSEGRLPPPGPRPARERRRRRAALRDVPVPAAALVDPSGDPESPPASAAVSLAFCPEPPGVRPRDLEAWDEPSGFPVSLASVGVEASSEVVPCACVLLPPPPRPPRRRRRERGRGEAESSPALGCAGTSSVMPRSFHLWERGAPIRPACRAARVAWCDAGLGRHDRHDSLNLGRECGWRGRCHPNTRSPVRGSRRRGPPAPPTGYQREAPFRSLEPAHVDVQHQPRRDEIHQEGGPPVRDEG